MDALGIHIPLLIILNNFISCLTLVFLEAHRKPPGQLGKQLQTGS